ncbi:uncharacterized protein OCT59_017726 [Rhizophagus irregularis]|uniref:uncharacterized protein n=1 Tax=Rhizophagus irregularis TaxID=588596 RepID=UPI00331965C0|nr:hypothetical protein OCT59_017726 [Rhizophagus irregularis]
MGEVKIHYVFYGITQDPETKDYMMNWERGQNMMVQLKRLDNPINIALEFIIEAKNYYKVYGITQEPKTKDYMMVLNEECRKCNINWERGQNMMVQLKRLDNPINIALEFIIEAKNYYKVYGITQEPKTKDYMMVLNEECRKLFVNEIALHNKLDDNYYIIKLME